MSPFSRLSSLLRGRNRVDPEVLGPYGEAIGPILQQLGRIYPHWRAALEREALEDELANIASIQRWEAAGLAERLQAQQAPAPLARQQAELQSIASHTARAAQLLSNSYRFHHSSTRCDGQALMLDVEERFQALRRTLVEIGLSVAPESDDAPSVR
jgi:hypothetical protein